MQEPDVCMRTTARNPAAHPVHKGIEKGLGPYDHVPYSGITRTLDPIASRLLRAQLVTYIGGTTYPGRYSFLPEQLCVLCLQTPLYRVLLLWNTSKRMKKRHDVVASLPFGHNVSVQSAGDNLSVHSHSFFLANILQDGPLSPRHNLIIACF